MLMFHTGLQFIILSIRCMLVFLNLKKHCTTKKVCPRKFDKFTSNICLALFAPRYIMRQRGHVDAAQGRPEHVMHLAVVACGDRLEETRTMIKSAVLFSIKSLYLHIFAEDQLHATFMEAVSWKRNFDPQVAFCCWSE